MINKGEDYFKEVSQFDTSDEFLNSSLIFDHIDEEWNEYLRKRMIYSK